MNPSLKQLAKRFGTPFYAYDLDVAKQRAEDLLSIFAGISNSRLMYSFKANPLPSLAGELNARGCQADITSTGELAVARQSGFDLSKALFGGPGKTAEEFSAALAAGVEHFSIESWGDLSALGESVRACGKNGIKVILRVNPSEPPKARVAMAGVASQFGFEEADLLGPEAKGKMAGLSDIIDFSGFHIYWGTQLGDLDALSSSFECAIQLAERLSLQTGIPLRILNLGGGFPWPYAHEGSGPDLTGLGERLTEMHANAELAKDAQWWFESGRFLTASSGSLVTQIVDIKQSKDRLFAIMDSGINHLGGMAGLGRIPRFSVDVVPENPREGEVMLDLVGQLCTPLDCVARNLKTTELKAGDLVEIPNVGAYGVTASLTGFLSRPVPLEIAHRSGEVVALHRLRSGHEQCDHDSFSSPAEERVEESQTASV